MLENLGLSSKVVIRLPYLSLVVIVALIAAGIYFDLKIPRNFFPNDPSGSVNVTAIAGPQDTITTLNQRLNKLSAFYRTSAVHYYSTRIDRDPTTGQITGQLQINYKDAYLHQNQGFSDQINQYIKQHHMQNMVAHMMNELDWGGGTDVDVVLYSDDSIQHLNAKARLLTGMLNKSAMFTHVSNSINLPQKQMAFDIRSVLAAQFGLYQTDLQQSLAEYYGGFQLNNFFNIDGLSVPVIVQLDKASLQNPTAIEQLMIRSPLSQQFFPLSKFVSMHMVSAPTIISSMNNQPSVHLRADLAKGYSLGGAIGYVNQLLATKASDLNYQYVGNAQDYLEGNTQSMLIVVLGLFCIYFLLAVLFNHLVDPFIILLTVPFSVVSGAFMLYLTGDSLNIFSTLALITLVGLITKHGVLIVQFANHQLHHGASVMEAIMAATHDRFRPIIMTTLAMTLGTVPLLFSQEVMYVARRDLGMVLICGLVVGTLFSLFVVPLAYTLIKKAEGSAHQ